AGGDCPYDVIDVMDVYFAVYHDKDLCEGQLSHSPQSHHDLFSLPGVLLFDGYYSQPLEPSCRRHRKIHHFGVEHLYERQKSTLYHRTDVGVFQDGLAHHGRKVDWIAPSHYCCKGEGGVGFWRSVVSRMVSKRPLHSHVVWIDIAFQDNFGAGGNLQVYSLAFHE